MMMFLPKQTTSYHLPLDILLPATVFQFIDMP
jgi:hypothetical protein